VQLEVASNPLFVNSLAKGLHVLSGFARLQRPASLSEVAERAELDRSATQRMLYTLKALGYVRQDETTRLYRLSSRVLQFSQAYLASDAVRAVAGPIIEQLANDTEETINLTELDGDEIVYILRFPSRHVVSVNLSIGTRLPAWCTAPGRAILAHHDPKIVRRRLAQLKREKLTFNTVTSVSKIMAILEEARTCGFVLSNQEAFVGDISVAAPIFNNSGEAVAAVNAAVPSPRWRLDDVMKHLAPAVMAAASEISSRLRPERR